MGNPRYNDVRGAANLVGAPPFDFDGVVLRAFPLRANMRALRRFCNQYLNLMPPEIAVFEPVAPYVLLMAINYGRMSPEASNLGWVSQNEVVFSVPLKRSRKVNGALEFEGWASVSPFIYVDEESSLATGREVYGWPKTLAWLTPGINEWARHPESPQNVLVLSSMVFPELFAGQRQEPRVLLEIERRPMPSLSRIPSDLGNPLNPLLSIPKAMIEGMSMAVEMAQAVAALPLQGYSVDRNPDSIPRMLGEAAVSFDLFQSLPIANTVNFKQFRDARDANAACYQAVTTAPMTVERYNGGGLLGELAQLRGDPSGGFSIRLHRYPTQPVIEALGLEVQHETDAGDHSLATLETFAPFWVDLDFKYGRGELVCWRTTQIGWRRGTIPDENPEPPSATAPKHPYNTARGAATEAVSGPFRFPDVTLRVLPLLGTCDRLTSFCREYLDNDFSFFQAWGDYVYMIVTTFEEMSSDTYNVGWWANRQVTFSFPVRWYKRKRVRQGEHTDEMEQGDLIGTAMVTPFAYTDSELGATTGREMQGLPMVKASIESPQSSWLEESGPAQDNDLLRLSTKVYSALNAGQEHVEQLLLEITARKVLPDHDTSAWRRVAAEWGERLYREQVERHRQRTEAPVAYNNLRALALEVLRGGAMPINEISLRQFRDVEEPRNACYQAITLTRTTIEELEELCEIDDPMHVAIHRHASQPVVDSLGLKVKVADVTGRSVVDYLEPIRPFWMKVSMRVDLGEDVFWRAGSEAWKPGSADWFESVSELEKRPEPDDVVPESPAETIPRALYLVGADPKVAPAVGPGLVDAIDKDESGDLKRNLRSAWRFWRYPNDEEPTVLTRQEAKAALGDQPIEEDISPQLIIEGLLQHEWGRQTQQRGETPSPEFFIPSNSIGNQEVLKEFGSRLGLERIGNRLVQRESLDRLFNPLPREIMRYDILRSVDHVPYAPVRYEATTALIVVDVQNDFADPSGSLYVPAGEEVIEPINREIELALEAGAFVVYTQDWHPESTPHFEKDGGIWPVHCVGGTWGAEFHPDLRTGEPTVRKGTGSDDGYSGFSVRDPETGKQTSTGLVELLRENAITRVAIVGLALDYCVKATALDAISEGFDSTVLLAATRAVDSQMGDGNQAIAELQHAGVMCIPPVHE